MTRTQDFNTDVPTKVLNGRSAAPCLLCSCLIWYEIQNGNPRSKREWDEVQRRCFHEKCRKCPDVSAESLCEACQHMRLGHILACGLKMQPANQRNGESSSIPNELGLRRIILRLGSLGDLQQQAGRCTACHAFCQTMSFRGNTKAAANIYLTLSPEEGEWGFAVQLSTDLPGRHPSDSPMEKKKTKKKTKKKLQLNAYETKKPNNPLQRVFSEQWNQMRKMMNPTFLFKNIRFLRLPWAQTGKNIN